MSAARALIYLQLTQLLGLIRFRLKRLKQPKYLLGACVGAAYFYFLFLRRAVTRPGHPSLGHAFMPEPSLIAALASAILLVFLLLNWIVPRPAANLAFSEAEIAFLFPAPVSRRALVHYRLLRSQAALVLTAAVITLFSNRWTYVPGPPVSHALGWWVILATLSLHGTASSFVIARLAKRGIPAWLTYLLVLAGILGLAALTVVYILHHGLAHAAAVPGHAATNPFLSVVSALPATPPIPEILALPRLLVAPFLAPTWGAFALALPAALGLVALHYVWALLSVFSFEEVAVLTAEKRAARAAARQSGEALTATGPLKARQARFRLAPTGRPETAFLWKNLLATPPIFRPSTVGLAAASLVVGRIWLAAYPAYSRAILPAVTMGALIVAIWALVLGPQMARHDLRAEILHADLLKTYPLHGWQIVLGELLMPTAILTSIVWLALLAGVLAASPHEIPLLTLPARASIALALALLAPAICALQLIMPNALAVLFPAWTLATGNRSERGLEVLGQRLIVLVGQLLVMLLALLPPALGAVAVLFIVSYLTGWIVAVMVAALAVVVALAVEIGLAVRWLGHRFERLDVSTELRG